MSTAKGYHDALLTLSGNPVFAAARDALLASISDNELLDVITHGLQTGSPRETLNAIATRLLDGLATAGRVGDAVLPAGDNNGGGDDEGDHDDSGRGGGRKDSGGSSGHAAQRGDTRWPIQTVQQKPTETPTTKGTRSSTADNKRKGDCLMQDGKKRRNLSAEPMDDEEDLVKAENTEEQGVAKQVAEKDGLADSSSAKKTASSASETDSDTDTSLDQDTPWKRTQKLSVMPDLNLVDSDDEDDGDYSGEVFPTPLPTPRIKKASQIPDIDLSFWVPTAKECKSKSLKDFPIAFVKWVIRKFNEDYLKTSADRREYQKLVEGSYNGRKCVSRKLEKDWSASWGSANVKWTCVSCEFDGKLCAKFWKTANGKGRLTIYPLASSGIEDWQSTDFWVKKSVG